MNQENVMKRGRLWGRLSQFMQVCQSTEKKKKRTYCGLIVFGMFVALAIGIVSWPPIDRGGYVAKAENRSTTMALAEEKCRWQKDLAYFSLLEDGSAMALPDEAACEKLRAVKVPGVGEVASVENDLGKTIREVAAGYPLEAMAPAIAQYDREVAALIVGIAKKESNWGKRIPRDAAGLDCFNYWGWKGAGSRGVSMGHGCFGSPEEAVRAVGNRLTELVKQRQTSEPKNLTVWKCGASCASQSRESVAKWVSDIDIYYQRIAKQ